MSCGRTAPTLYNGSLLPSSATSKHELRNQNDNQCLKQNKYTFSIVGSLSTASYFITTIFKIYFLYYVYECFTCMCVCVPGACLVVSHHIGAGNWTFCLLQEQKVLLTDDPSPQRSSTTLMGDIMNNSLSREIFQALF